MTAAELQEHPEFKHVIWDMKAGRKEKLSVAKGRGGPFDIAFEARHIRLALLRLC
jgi:hypothetical protein